MPRGFVSHQVPGLPVQQRVHEAGTRGSAQRGRPSTACGHVRHGWRDAHSRPSVVDLDVAEDLQVVQGQPRVRRITIGRQYGGQPAPTCQRRRAVEVTPSCSFESQRSITSSGPWSPLSRERRGLDVGRLPNFDGRPWPLVAACPGRRRARGRGTASTVDGSVWLPRNPDLRDQVGPLPDVDASRRSLEADRNLSRLHPARGRCTRKDERRGSGDSAQGASDVHRRGSSPASSIQRGTSGNTSTSAPSS